LPTSLLQQAATSADIFILACWLDVLVGMIPVQSENQSKHGPNVGVFLIAAAHHAPAALGRQRKSGQPPSSAGVLIQRFAADSKVAGNRVD
jgi:hypothetical protein